MHAPFLRSLDPISLNGNQKKWGDLRYFPQHHRVMTIGTTQRKYDQAGNTIEISPQPVIVVDDPPPGGGGETESAAYEGTEQTAIGLDDGNPPPGIATKTFAYNAANRMASVSENGELLMSYRYNGAGERVYRSGSGQTAHTVFDPNGQWIGDYDEYGQVIQQAIWLGDLPVGLLARLDGGERRLFYIQPDALGTPRVVIDPTRGTQGTAVWRWELEDEAFGETEPNQDPDGDNTLFVLDMRYPGQQHDSATGFNYNYFRDYDASTGRYVQSDPVGLLGGINTFAYVSARPLIAIDKYGLSEECDECAPNSPRFDRASQAARHILRYIVPVSLKHRLEICGNICRDGDGKFFWTGPIVGVINKCWPNGGVGSQPSSQCPSCSKRVAAWHTHPANGNDWWDKYFEPVYDSEGFSPGDRAYSDLHSINNFLGTPSGSS